MSCVILSFSSQQRQTVHWKLGFERCYYILAKEKQVCNLKQFIFFFMWIGKMFAFSNHWLKYMQQVSFGKLLINNEGVIRTFLPMKKVSVIDQ